MDKYNFSENKYWYIHAVPYFEQHLKIYIGQKVDCLEVGSFQGSSALWLLENILTHPESTIICVDPWTFGENTYDIFCNNVAISGFAHKITDIQQKSHKALKLPIITSKQYDFIYIDGEHRFHNPLEDAVLSFRLLKNGGIIGFDDYAWPEGNVKQCLDSFLTVYGEYFKILHKDWQIWLQKNPENPLTNPPGGV